MPEYLVTTDKSLIPGDRQIIMLDGTVPKWMPNEGDIHYDHHRPGGASVQIAEMPDLIRLAPCVSNEAVIVTTQVDADACVAAAWCLLSQEKINQSDEYEIYQRLWAIAHDCDHLGLPHAEKYNHLREFAAKAVAALKQVGGDLVASLGLPSDRKEWTETHKTVYASAAFKQGSEWLRDAALGLLAWPGEKGEADPYFEKMEAQREQVYANCRVYRGCGIFDQRSFNEYVDPRLFVQWCREQDVFTPITLTMRSGDRQPNAKALEGVYASDLYSYTLGSVTLHKLGSPKFSDRGVWQKLSDEESLIRGSQGLPMAETQWGGRNEVGGSSWRDPVITRPERVIDIALAAMPDESDWALAKAQ